MEFINTIVIGATPIITAFKDPIVIESIKNTCIYIGMSQVFDRALEVNSFPFTIVPFFLWNTGKIIIMIN